MYNIVTLITSVLLLIGCAGYTLAASLLPEESASLRVPALGKPVEEVTKGIGNPQQIDIGACEVPSVLNGRPVKVQGDVFYYLYGKPDSNYLELRQLCIVARVVVGERVELLVKQNGQIRYTLEIGTAEGKLLEMVKKDPLLTSDERTLDL